MDFRVETKPIKYQPDSFKNESGFLFPKRNTDFSLYENYRLKSVVLKNMRGAKTVLIWFGKRTEKNEKMERIKTGFVLKSE